MFVFFFLSNMGIARSLTCKASGFSLYNLSDTPFQKSSSETSHCVLLRNICVKICDNFTFPLVLFFMTVGGQPVGLSVGAQEREEIV